MKTAAQAGVGVYARISLDFEGKGLGVKRQEEDCRALASLRGWSVADTFIDNSVSAFKRGVTRPAYERMLDALEAGALDGIVVYDMDRLTRRLQDLERLIDIFDKRKGECVFATVQGDINLASPDGMTMARFLIVIANKSSMDTARRRARKHLESAQRGELFSPHRPFGWQDDKISRDAREAKLLRDAAKQILSGVPISAIVRAWNEAGVPTVRNGTWKIQTLRQILVSPRLAGWRVYQRGIALDAGGQQVKGPQQPILDEQTWAAVRATLSPGVRCVGVRRYLLSGIARCGKCGAVMYGRNKAEVGTYDYACPGKAVGGCGGCAIRGPETDALVTDLLLDRYKGRTAIPEVPGWDGADELEQTSAKIAELMTAFRTGQLSKTVVFPAIAQLETQVRELQQQAAAHARGTSRAITQPANVARTWPRLSVDQKRRIMQDALSAVVIGAGQRGGIPLYRPERVTPVWR